MFADTHQADSASDQPPTPSRPSPPPQGQPGYPAFDRGPVVFTLLTALGSAMLALGLLFAWQAWSSRSDEPIDDVLPRLIAAGQRAEPVATPGPRADTITVPAPATAGSGVRPQASGPAMASESLTLVVHVSGEVEVPGIVHLVAGDRVHHAVASAGGLGARADVDRVNLAAPVADGDRIHIPRVGEQTPDVLGPQRSIGAGGVPGIVSLTPVPLMVDLNAATLTELTALPGIGPSLAQAILTTRVDRGPFRSIDELTEVTGIGPAKLEQIRPFVNLDRP